ncbi:MAG: undecaprenyl-diphosphate phosphatase [Sneathiella sp.]
MNLTQIIALAIVQGITEFLPISSSGHLLLVPMLTGWPDQGLSLDIATHVGTLFAVLLYFRADLIFMLKGIAGRSGDEENRQGRQLFTHLVIGSVPAVVAGGLLFFIFQFDFRSMLVIASTTIFFGAVLGIADRFFKGDKTLSEMSNWDAFFIGVMQIFALIPGTSRSGVTMAAALFRGLDRSRAAHFSMLLSIPVIVGAGVAAAVKIAAEGELKIGFDALIACGISFIVAFLVINVLMTWIKRIGYMPFVWYRFALGAVLLALYFYA